MKENDIRPEALLRRYLELSEQDATLCFENGDRDSVPCAGCAGTNIDFAFEKYGFSYGQCKDCGTLFQSPRPKQSAFEAFYRDSKSSNYWAETFFPAVAEARREKIFQPRVARLAAMCDDRGLEIKKLIDVGAGYGIFLDEWRKKHPLTQMVAIEPSNSLASEIKHKGFEVVENIVEHTGPEYEKFADLVVCFEVLEHVYEPLSFLQSLIRLARPGGLVFVSTLCIDGFDLQVLWEKSSQISPPHHINFLSVAGFERLFSRAGLKDVSVTTPGKLDVDIVRNAGVKDPTLLSDQRFLQKIVTHEESMEKFQIYLEENRLSSHAWVLGKVPEETTA